MKSAVGVEGLPHVLIPDPQGIVRWEGYPLLQGYELSEKVAADIIAKTASSEQAGLVSGAPDCLCVSGVAVQSRLPGMKSRGRA